MQNVDWNEVAEWLKNSHEGDWAEHEGRTVEIVDMCGGRYLLLDKDGEVAGLVDTEQEAVLFLKSGHEEVES